MAQKNLIASRGMRYGTRMLTAGEAFTADGPRARLLVALGDAAEAAMEAPASADAKATNPAPKKPRAQRTRKAKSAD